MKTTIKSQSEKKLTLEIEINLEGSMLEMEEKILEALNHAGSIATLKALERFDADGSPIEIGNQKLSSKGLQKKTSRHRMER